MSQISQSSSVSSGLKGSVSNCSRQCFSSACKEVQDHLSVCTVLAQFLEDISVVERGAGAQLIKIGNNSGGGGSFLNHTGTIEPGNVNNTHGGTFSIPEIGNAIKSREDNDALLSSLIGGWESIINLSATVRGKLCVSLSTSISQNICKTLPENVKSLSRRVAAVVSRVQPLSEKLWKAKIDAQKLQDSYSKLTADTIAAVRARDGALSSDNESSTAGSNSATGVAVESTSPPKASGTEPSDFVNRSFNKLMSKMNPTTNQLADRKIQDMVRELDSTERLLDNKCSKIGALQGQLEEMITAALEELDAVEKARLNLMREGLIRLHAAEETVVCSMGDSAAKLLTLIESLNFENDIASLVAEIDKPAGMPSSQQGDANYEVDDIVVRVQKAIESMDYFSALTSKAHEQLQEVAEAEKSYSKNLTWAMEKHGYQKSSSASGSFLHLARQISQLTQTSCASVLSTAESPSTRKSWEAAIKAMSNLGDVIYRSAEDSETVSTKLDAIRRRLEAMRRELSDKVAQKIRKIDIASGNAQSKRGKLGKVQREIKEKRLTVKKARDELSRQSNGGGSITAPGSPMVAQAVDRSATPSPESDPRGARPTAGLDTLIENFGSTLRTHTDKLGVVVGLESEGDRVNRIENKVVVLENEERSMIEALKGAEAVLHGAIDAARTELGLSLNLAKECLCSDFDALKAAMRSSVTALNQNAALLKEIVNGIRAAHDHIDQEQDMHYFVTMVSSSAESMEGDAMDMMALCLSSDLTTFRPLTDKALAEERQALDIPPFVHKPYTPSSLMQAFSSPTVLTKKVMMDDQAAVLRLPSPELSNLPRGAGSDVLSEGRQPNGIDDGYRVTRRRSRSAGSIDETMRENEGRVASPQLDDDSSSLSRGVSSPVPQSTYSPNTPHHKGSAITTAPSRRVFGSYISSEKAQGREGRSGSDQTFGMDFHKFGLSAKDRVLDSYSCAYYPKKGLLTHGRMFVLQHYIAFSGWPDTHILIPLQVVVAVQKMNTVKVFPNAIQIDTKSGEYYFFGSFVEREKAYLMLTNLATITKELHSLDVPKVPLVDPSDPQVIMPTFDLPKHTPHPPKMDGNGVKWERHGGVTGDAGKNASPAAAEPPSISIARLFPDSEPEVTEGKSASGNSSDEHSEGSQSLAAPVHRTEPVAVAAKPTNPDDGVLISSLFEKSNVFPLHSQQVAGSISDIWQSCWLLGSGYGDFLESQGDLEVKTGEWEPMSAPCAEDITRLPFSHKRPFSYSHPRTTMLM